MDWLLWVALVVAAWVVVAAALSLVLCATIKSADRKAQQDEAERIDQVLGVRDRRRWPEVG